MKLTGTFLYWDQKNLNDRTYPKSIAEKMVNEFNKREEASFGELGYPKENFQEINVRNISHKIEEIHINEENKSIEGTIEILDTPSGKMVKEILEEVKDSKLSCRPRGVGEVDEDGNVTNFELISFDLVAGEDAFGNIKGNNYIKIIKDE